MNFCKKYKKVASCHRRLKKLDIWNFDNSETLKHYQLRNLVTLSLRNYACYFGTLALVTLPHRIFEIGNFENKEL